MELYADGIVISHDDRSQALYSDFRYANRCVSVQEYVVREGDTLFSIANKKYRDTRFWWTIAELNPDIDPLALEIGTTIYIPQYV